MKIYCEHIKKLLFSQESSDFILKRCNSVSGNLSQFSNYGPHLLHKYILKPFRLEKKYFGRTRRFGRIIIIRNGGQIVIQVRSSAGLN